MAMSSAFQFSCVVLLVVHLAAGVPATECQSAECGSSLLMHSAGVKGANLSLAEDSLQPAQGVSRAQTLLGSMQSLAEKVVSGEEKISNVTRLVLGSIKTQMETVINDTKITFEEDQAELNAAHGAIEACGTKATTDHTSANGVNSLQQNVVTKRDGHRACRAFEKLNLTSKITSCNAFQTYASGLSPPACTSQFPPGPSAATLTCIQAMATWSNTANNTYLPKKDLCDGATTVHSDTKETCDSQQGTFESAFCTYATVLTKTCEDQTSCRSTAITARNTAHARVAIAEAGRKAEYEAAKNVICLLTVLAGDAADMPGLLVGCEALIVDTSILSLTYPTIPGLAACDTSPVATKPCDAGWLQTEYSSQTGWYDFTQYNTLTSAYETVALQTCTACSVVVTTTTTTAEATTTYENLGAGLCQGASNACLPRLFTRGGPTLQECQDACSWMSSSRPHQCKGVTHRLSDGECAVHGQFDDDDWNALKAKYPDHNFNEYRSRTCTETVPVNGNGDESGYGFCYAAVSQATTTTTTQGSDFGPTACIGSGCVQVVDQSGCPKTHAGLVNCLTVTDFTMGPVASFKGLNGCKQLEKVSLAGNWDGTSTKFDYSSHAYIGNGGPGVDFTFPPGLYEIGIQSFYNSKFASTTLELPDSVETILKHAFYSQRNKFERVILGSKLTTISEEGDGAFWLALADTGCYSFSGANPPWYDVANKRLPGTDGSSGLPCP